MQFIQDSHIEVMDFCNEKQVEQMQTVSEQMLFEYTCEQIHPQNYTFPLVEATS